SLRAVRLLLAGLLARLEAAHLVVQHAVVALESADGRGIARQPEIVPAARDVAIHLLAEGRALREDRQVAVLLSGVDGGLGAVRALLGAGVGWVGPRGPWGSGWGGRLE